MTEKIVDYVDELLEREGVLLECKRCGNTDKFHYRETVGCTIISDESEMTGTAWYPFKQEEIECVDCGHILWREGD